MKAADWKKFAAGTMAIFNLKITPEQQSEWDTKVLDGKIFLELAFVFFWADRSQLLQESPDRSQLLQESPDWSQLLQESPDWSQQICEIFLRLRNSGNPQPKCNF
jgi:hypothetical protein